MNVKIERLNNLFVKELSEIISLETKIPITKSGLHHRFKKISDLAERIKD